jgi:hypothetical protein
MNTLIKAVVLATMTFLVPGGAVAQDPHNQQPLAEATTVFEEEEPAASSAVTPEAYSSGCDTSGGSTQVKGGGVGVSSPSYPCEVMRTREAMAGTVGHGFVQGKMARFFLRGRLITKGVFSLIFVLVGLG